MTSINQLFLFLWVLILLGVVCFIIKQLAFGRRKTNESINTSEGIYLAGLIISSAIIFKEAIASISIAFNNIIKIHPGNYYYQFIKASSAISVSGIIIFIIILFIAKILLLLFFGNRKAFVEFSSDNKAYALVYAVLVCAISYMLIQMGESVFDILIPSIDIPFYR